MNSKQIQKQHEKCVCDSLVETLNSNAIFERYGNDLDEPDCIYKVNERSLGIEVGTAYYSNLDAEQEWTLARGERKIPKQDYEWNWPSASLENLPQKIAFPNHLKDKIYYKPREKLLIFKGRMSKEEKDELLRLSPDKHYRNAIEELYRGLIINQDDLICERIKNEINDKCRKKYSGVGKIWLCIEVRAPLCDEDEVNEFLPSIYIPEKHCFDAIYLSLYEGGGNYKVFKIYGNQIT